MTRKQWWIPKGIIVIAFAMFLVACGTTPTEEEPAQTAPEEDTPEEEVVVSADEWSDTFKDSCLTCHAVDDSGHVERISDMRKTPEGWQDTISRMQTAWGLEITDEDKDAIIKELSSKNGLAPEETEAVMYWLTDSGSVFEPMEQDEFDRMQNACLSCHAGARSLAQYRTEEEWHKLLDFHVGFNPSTVYQMRGVNFEEEAEEILTYLSSIQPMESDAWKAWQEQQVDYDFSGEWRIVGHRPGVGMYSGYATIEAKDDNYFENRELLHSDGETEQQEGNVRSYSGYSLRSSLQNDSDDKLKGVFNLSVNEEKMTGRWNDAFDKGLYGDETYYRVNGPDLLAASTKALRNNEPETVRLIGNGLTENITADDFTVSDGLTFESIEEQNGDDVWVNVKIDGSQDTYTIALAEGGSEVEFASYEQIDYIKTFPEQGYARLVYSDHKQSVQLEAIAYSNGPDGEEGTEDDIEISTVQVDWELLEFHEEGDDVAYVGEIDEHGLFTPSEGGPNEDRPWSTNNMGTVIAKATLKGDEKLTSESILVITLPDYVYVN